MQEFVNQTKNNSVVREFLGRQSRRDAARKENKVDIETNLNKLLKDSKADDSNAMKELNNFLHKNDYQNFEQAEKAMLLDIKEALIEALDDPKSESNAVSILGSFHDASPSFITMLLSLKPNHLRKIMVALAHNELNSNKSSLPFRQDNLFSKLFREKTLNELGGVIRDPVKKLINTCIQSSEVTLRQAALQLLIDLRTNLQQTPPSAALREIFNDIHNEMAHSAYARQSQMLLMNVILLRGINFLINNPESLEINFSDPQRSAAAKATIVLMEIANIEKAETEDSRLLLELVPLLTGQESKANTNNKP